MAKSKPAKLPAHQLDLNHARARWHARQGLAAPAAASPHAVVQATGWPRTLGGTDVYLAVRARCAGMRRADLDRAVEGGALRVVPAARSCIYVVPRAQVPLVLRIAEALWRPRTERELIKAGTSWQEVDEIAAAVVVALAGGPCSPDALRKLLPSGTVRSLGEAGKKIGMSSALPVALRTLEFAGRVERTLATGRLDSERYAWRLPVDGSLALDLAAMPNDPGERLTRLAAIFFQHAAPATVQDFAEWAALSQRDARAAVERIGLIPVSVAGYAAEAWAFAADLETPPPADNISLLPFEDNYLTYHGGPALLTDPAQHGRAIPVWGSKRGSTLGEVKYMAMRAVLLGDRLVGFWEYHPDSQRVVWSTFSPLPPRQREALAAESAALAAFLREQLGHARSFSLDTDDNVRQRAALVEELR